MQKKSYKVSVGKCLQEENGYKNMKNLQLGGDRLGAR